MIDWFESYLGKLEPICSKSRFDRTYVGNIVYVGVD